MMRANRLIAILTDFGGRDPYVGVMKGVIKNINPSAEFIDITNNVSRHSILAGAFALYTSYRYFPQETVFLVVIDPGVGTKRKPILVKTKNYYFIAPDNGVLYPTVVDDGIEKIIWLKNKDYFLERISETFHGRDIFAPSTAYVSKGVDIEDMGERIDLKDIVKLELIHYETQAERIRFRVNYIDVFGNVITSVPNEILSLQENSKLKLYLGRRELPVRVVRTYAQGKKGELLILYGSQGFLEIAINQGDASKYLGINIGDQMILSTKH